MRKKEKLIKGLLKLPLVLKDYKDVQLILRRNT